MSEQLITNLDLNSLVAMNSGVAQFIGSLENRRFEIFTKTPSLLFIIPVDTALVAPDTGIISFVFSGSASVLQSGDAEIAYFKHSESSVAMTFPVTRSYFHEAYLGKFSVNKPTGSGSYVQGQVILAENCICSF